MIRLVTGDCRETLPTLAERSVQACITSPPYYGLRDYGTDPLAWGGDSDHAHLFGAAIRAPWANEVPGPNTGGKNDARNTSKASGALCTCGAWRGSLGLEPTLDLYVEHLVEIFGHVRRVLHDDGVLWLNIGDSYAGSGRGPSNSLNRSNPHSHQAAETMKRGLNNLRDTPTSWMPLQQIGPQEHTIGHGRVPGLKPKDLMMVPFRVALALQDAGWYLRSVIPWIKRNSMPESASDRPANSIEYVFLLAKSQRYFWDADAVRMTGSGWIPRKEPTRGQSGKAIARAVNGRTPDRDGGYGAGLSRNRRNADWFFESWQGLLGDEDGDPLALVVNLASFSGAHFATFPAKLIEPMVKASTRPGDTVLDPFGGAGTTGLVADRFDRDAVLCELKPGYVDMATTRVASDAPLFTEVVA